MIKHDDTYRIGQISKTHGLRGELVFQFTDDIFDRADCDYLICDVDGILVPFFIEEYRFRSDSSALVKFEDIDSADDAQRLVGCEVRFENRFITDGDEEEVSLSYFIGFTVVDTDGTPIGTIVDIDDQTENWLFGVERAQTIGPVPLPNNSTPDADEVLIPAHEEFITDINHKDRIIEMDLPLGLLEL